MSKVFKYPLPISDVVEVVMPKDAKVLAVQIQNGTPCIWAAVNSTLEVETRTFRIAGTGHSIVDEIVDDYVGTFQLHDGQLVFMCLKSNEVGMQKIMFNERFGLQTATLKRLKWMTRRIEKSLASLPTVLGKYESVIPHKEGDKFIVRHYWKGALLKSYEIVPKYKVGEIVAIAQSYKEIDHRGIVGYADASDFQPGMVSPIFADQSKGWENKMFVRADLMPNHIEITNVRLERLQDISDVDCLAEGIVYEPKYAAKYCYKYGDGLWKCYRTPQDAYSMLIDRISGKGTWDKNPWVLVYIYELQEELQD